MLWYLRVFTVLGFGFSNLGFIGFFFWVPLLTPNSRNLVVQFVKEGIRVSGKRCSECVISTP